SVRQSGETGFRPRREVKNLNSFKFLRQALEYERDHQIAVYETGGTIEQATLLFDSARGETFVMRGKEEAHDYRYFPEPDLPPLLVGEACVAHARGALPELPWQMHARFVRQYGLSAYDAGVLTDNAALAAYFERVAALCDAKLAANWVTGDLAALLKERALEIEQSPVAPASLAEMIKLIEQGTISGKIAKEVLTAMADGEGSPARIVAQKGLRQISDESALAALIDEALAESPEQLAQFRAGKDKLFGYFVGQVMKKTQGQANPQEVNRLLREKLNG
nr:Asp-tRNA(Asn)/Glu-tRNA(Gln) amidotransferase GatCAB subunit B [bacterium]